LNPHYWYLPNPDLGPETSGETEFGVSYSRDGLGSGRTGVFAKAMYFTGTIDDMISFRTLPDLGTSPEDSPYGTYQNVEKADRDGFEIAASFYTGGLSLDASFEHLDIVDVETEEKVPQAFADKARLAASYTFQAIDLTVGAEVSHWFSPDQNPESIWSRGVEYFFVTDEFTIANLRLRWQPRRLSGFFNETFQVHLGVDNIFDDTYINARNVETTSRSGKGRNIWLNVSKTF
jgi:iron complex outermembrane receptor protein/hemoglobin/transferrin/lactoferrin receptor protein